MGNYVAIEQIKGSFNSVGRVSTCGVPSPEFESLILP